MVLNGSKVLIIEEDVEGKNMTKEMNEPLDVMVLVNGVIVMHFELRFHAWLVCSLAHDCLICSPHAGCACLNS